MTAGDFNSTLTTMDESSRKKIKDTVASFFYSQRFHLFIYLRENEREIECRGGEEWREGDKRTMG